MEPTNGNQTDIPSPKHDIPTKPKLVYFNAQGRAEIIRMIFHYVGISFEDYRFRNPPYAMDDFQQYKKNNDLPFGQVPILIIDGMKLAQSQAIVRYLARKYGLMAESDMENALADMVHCGTEDLRQKFTSALLNNNSNSENDFQMIKFKNEICSNWGNYFESLLSNNGGKWFVGSKMTYADFAVYDTLSNIIRKIPNAFDNFPLLKNHIETIENVPAIKQWLKNRPQANF